MHSNTIDIVHVTQLAIEPFAEHLELMLLSKILVELFRSELFVLGIHLCQILVSVNSPEQVSVLFAKLRIHNWEHMEPRETNERIARIDIRKIPLERDGVELCVIRIVPVLWGDSLGEDQLPCERGLDQMDPVSSLVGEGLGDLVSAKGAEGLGAVFADEGAVAEGGHLCLKAGWDMAGGAQTLFRGPHKSVLEGSWKAYCNTIYNLDIL